LLWKIHGRGWRSGGSGIGLFYGMLRLHIKPNIYFGGSAEIVFQLVLNYLNDVWSVLFYALYVTMMLRLIFMLFLTALMLLNVGLLLVYLI
jgi:hypothetical protein